MAPTAVAKNLAKVPAPAALKKNGGSVVEQAWKRAEPPCRWATVILPYLKLGPCLAASRCSGGLNSVDRWRSRRHSLRRLSSAHHIPPARMFAPVLRGFGLRLNERGRSAPPAPSSALASA